MSRRILSTQISLLILAGTTALTLNACTSDTKTASTNTTQSTTTAPASPIAASPPKVTTAPSALTPTTAKGTGAQYGGQVVEMGDYHLELLAAPEGDNIHVDFWLLTKSDYASISDAKVTANIQFPNGTQKTVDMAYDTTGKHYKALIPGFVTGDYRVVVQTNTKGEKVNGRFNFPL